MIVSTEKAIQIVDMYGPNHQRYKAAEELAELQTLVLQDANLNGKVPTGRIIEEIADVYVMLSQLEIIYQIDSRDIEPVIEYKLERTLERARRNEEWQEKAQQEVNKKKQTQEEQWNVLPLK